MVILMYEDFIAERLRQLRTQKQISAREMSLAIGQNESYINRIENQKSYPSMRVFLDICKYLNITAYEFFNMENNHPYKISLIIDELKNLNETNLDTILAVAKGLCHESKKSKS